MNTRLPLAAPWHCHGSSAERRFPNRLRASALVILGLCLRKPTLSRFGNRRSGGSVEVRPLPIPHRACAGNCAYLLIEALVYIAAIGVLLGAGYAAMYRCLDSSVALRRNADDITSALHTGERWRTDVRSANGRARLEDTDAGQLLYLTGASSEVVYLYSTNGISRRLGAGPWVRLLPNVKSSTMQPDAREYVTAWRWDLELQPRTTGSVKPGHIRPLFTFLAVPKGTSTK